MKGKKSDEAERLHQEVAREVAEANEHVAESKRLIARSRAKLADQPLPEPPRDPGVTDEDISRRMERGIRKLLSTPHKPHQPKGGKKPKRSKP